MYETELVVKMQGVNQAKDDVQDLCRRGQEFLLRGQEMRVYL